MDFVKGILNLFTGGSDDAAKKAAAESRALTKVTQDRQLQALQDQERDNRGGRAARRAPRGRRLLIAEESGEQGVRRTLG